MSQRKRVAPATPSLPGGAIADSAADTASPAHDEWLLDEALTETFPASDPIHPATRSPAPATPGGPLELDKRKRSGGQPP